MEENAMHVEFTSLINRWTSPQPQKSPVSLGSVLDAQKHARLLERHNFDRLLRLRPRRPARQRPARLIPAAQHDVAFGCDLAPRPSRRSDGSGTAVATLDQLGAGRLAIRMVTATAVGLPGHGRALEHEAELARTDEYLVLLKRLW